MDYPVRLLIEQLVAKGIELTSIPAFIRDVLYAVAANPRTSLTQLNRRLQFSAWNDIELDDFTLQLIALNFESDIISEPTHSPERAPNPEKSKGKRVDVGQEAHK